MAWNFGEILNAVATITDPEKPALIHGNRTISKGDFHRRSNSLARSFLDGGAQPGDKIAFFMRNCAEYSEGIAAAFKAGLTHVNVNYRYIDHELIYLLDNSDATVVLYQSEFHESVDRIRDALPKVSQWVEVQDSTIHDETLATDYEHRATSFDNAPLERLYSADDLLFLYTGGTTGMPKGVMWQHNALFNAMGAGGNPRLNTPPSHDLEDLCTRILSQPGPVNLPLPPMMHGTGLLSAIGAMAMGGTCVTLPSKHFDPAQALRAIGDHQVTAVTIVGDAFARPILDTLDNAASAYDISSVKIVSSSGVMWTREIKAGLLAHNEELLLVDGFSSSEAIGLGSSVMTKDQTIDVAKFTIGPNCRVFTEDHREVHPGDNEPGMVAVRGHLPLGYYKDAEKTAKTFQWIQGERYSIPGDWVQVEADGSLTLLGRGSNCINTAGEKVFPEEVEEALKYHSAIEDVLVVGLPDPKWGQAITAVIQTRNNQPIDAAALRTWARDHLAAYKLPKHIFQKENLERAPNGKADYLSIRRFAETALAKPKDE
ncbi:MAG: AMP-binding protein [Pseudomonadales bacterium]|jgi:acyl-CoA synthetase (AMP-forming)/AMP-acid ligase II|nr:AMP-binding protein [Pseudomonadales bacterium]MDA0761039.1 AMP-binding protein [Pseudomonadota bacterium]MDA0957611.1 AMP-binding protein [Pseudomonadota bacterium]